MCRPACAVHAGWQGMESALYAYMVFMSRAWGTEMREDGGRGGWDEEGRGEGGRGVGGCGGAAFGDTSRCGVCNGFLGSWHVFPK